MEFDAYWASLIQAGWFETCSSERVADAHHRLQRVWGDDPAYTAYALGWPLYLPDAAQRGDFFLRVLDAYGQVSEGRFAAQEVTWARASDSEMTDLSFVARGVTYRSRFPFLHGELEPAIGRLCNSVLEAAGSPYRFFRVPHADAEAVVLVRPEAHEAIQGRGWLSIRALPRDRWGAVLEGADEPLVRLRAYADHVRSDEDLVELMSRSTDAVLREWAAEAAAVIPGAGDTALLRAISDPDRHVRAAACASLQIRLTDEQRESWTGRLIAAAAVTADAAVGAIEALGTLRTADGLRFVLHCVLDPRPPVRSAARSAMSRLDKNWPRLPLVASEEAYILEVLATTDVPQVQLDAMDLLGRLGTKDAIPLLIDLLLRPDLAGAPLSTLDRIDDGWTRHPSAQQAAARFEQVARTGADEFERQQARHLLERVRGRLEDPESATAGAGLFEGILRSGDLGMRKAAVRMLAESSYDEAEQILARCRDEDPEPSVRELAEERLAEVLRKKRARR
jgi:hypothetical protein